MTFAATQTSAKASAIESDPQLPGALDSGHTIIWDAILDAVLFCVLSTGWSAAPARATEVLCEVRSQACFATSSTILQEYSGGEEDNGSGV